MIDWRTAIGETPQFLACGQAGHGGAACARLVAGRSTDREEVPTRGPTEVGANIEGLNNKAKLTMRKAYGFRTFPVIELVLYHALGKLPEPNVAHRFY
jgi:hypothetical protein